MLRIGHAAHATGVITIRPLSCGHRADRNEDVMVNAALGLELSPLSLGQGWGAGACGLNAASTALRAVLFALPQPRLNVWRGRVIPIFIRSLC